MKSKRLWLWITYYGVAIIANVVAAIVWKDKINFSGYSAFPIGCILIMALLSCFLQSKWVIKFYLWHEEYARRKWSDPSFTISVHDEENLLKEDRRVELFASKTFFIFIPLVLMFILFFSNGIKISSIGVPLFASLLSVLYTFYWLKEEDKKHQVSIDTLRKDQEKKEELGKWK